MANSLTVTEGTTVILDENIRTELAENLQKVQIRTLEDLVTAGLIDSQVKLQELLVSSQTVTEEALSRSETFTPFVSVPGSSRTNLRRFGSFIAATPNALPLERQAFWQIARQIEPISIPSLTSSLELATILPRWINREIIRALFDNVTVEPNSVLQINPAVKVFSCNELLIRRTGQIVVNGNNLKINAFSLAGE